MSKEIGSIGKGSTAPSTALTERGGARTSSVTETKTTNSRGYQPMFTISNDGSTTRLGGDTMKRNTSLDRKISSFTPFVGESSYFSTDKVSPKESAKFEFIIFQRATSEKKQFTTPDLKHKVTISGKDGIVTPRDNEMLYKKPELTSIEPVPARQLPKVESPAKESGWVTNQSRLSEQKDVRKDINPKKIEANKSNEMKLNPFTAKLHQRLTSVQNMQSKISDLEVKINKDLPNQPITQFQENKSLIEQIQKAAIPEVGKISMDPQREVIKGLAHGLTKEQAHLEIATKLQDGGKVASNMIKILESQGVEPQLAREVAVEKVTQTLVKTLKEKQLVQYLRNDEKQPQVDTQITQTNPKVEVKEYIDTEGHHIREKITTDEFDIVTIDREEIIAERDVIADANRIEMATQIGSMLLDKAHRGGSTNIHSREVAELMPEEPGEALVSFIRKQLNLLLDNEEQYDFFKDTLATAGYVATKYDVTKAAKYATDIAPAVRLTRKLTTEKVLPRDEERAVSRGNNFSLK